MNQRPTGLSISKAIAGFLQYKLAEGLSPNTVYGYDRDLKLWLAYMGDQDIGKITSANLLEFLNYLRSEYVPRRIARLDVKSWQPSGNNKHSSRNVKQALGSFKQPFRNRRSFTGRCDLPSRTSIDVNVAKLWRISG